MQSGNLVPRLQEKYTKEIVPLFLKKYGFSNKMAVPKVEKIVVNMSSARAVEDSKFLKEASGVLAKITGQKPLTTKARKSVSSFKLREGMPIGLKVTLRGKRMYEFLDRLIATALPRVRDFRGAKKDAFDGSGNYTLGIKEVTVFPEAAQEEDNFGLEVSIQTSTKKDNDAKKLLLAFGFPLKTGKEK